MFGQARVQLLEDRDRFQPARVGLVGRLLRGRQRERVEDRRLDILWILRGEVGHRIAVRKDARPLISGVGVGVELGDGIDEPLLAGRFRAGGARTVDGVHPPLDLRRRAIVRREGIAPVAQRDPPGRDAARRVRFQRRFQRVDGAAELERMDERDASIERHLRGGVAGVRERDLSKLVERRGRMLVLLRRDRNRRERERNDAPCLHGTLRLRIDYRSDTVYADDLAHKRTSVPGPTSVPRANLRPRPNLRPPSGPPSPTQPPSPSEPPSPTQPPSPRRTSVPPTSVPGQSKKSVQKPLKRQTSC